MTIHRPINVAPGYSAEDWRRLKLEPDAVGSADWQSAIAIFETRMRRRFFEPVDALIDFEDSNCEKTFGFAILAIDCLVMETLQGFRDGVVNHRNQSERLFKKFLTGWGGFKNCVPKGGDAQRLAKRVYVDCRCALLHSGATDGELRVGVSGPVFEFSDAHVQRINRTALHASLKEEFDAYLASLRAEGGKELRRNLKTKMDAVCGAKP